MATRPDALELALVDKDLLLKLLKHPPPPPTPIAPPPDADLTQMVTTDRAMGNLLKSQTMTPRSKRDAYNELLQVKNLHAQRYADDNVFKNTTTTLHNPPPTVKRARSAFNPPSGARPGPRGLAGAGGDIARRLRELFKNQGVR